MTTFGLRKLLTLPFLPLVSLFLWFFHAPSPELMIIHRVTWEPKQVIISLYVFLHISCHISSSCIGRRIKGSQSCCSHFHSQNCLQDCPCQSPLSSPVHQPFDLQLMNVKTRWATELLPCCFSPLRNFYGPSPSYSTYTGLHRK